MKKNLKVYALLLSIPMIGIAFAEDDLPPKNYKDFHLPESKIEIVSSNKLKIPASLKSEIYAHVKQQKIKGYYDSNSMDALELIAMKNKDVVALQSKDLKTASDPYDTHMKRRLSEIKLAFPYKKITLSEKSYHIGFAAVGMWDDKNKGWTGIKEFFDDKNLGVCSFTLYNIALSHGSVKISEDSVRYDVNNKPTIITVRGGRSNGFMYTVSWYEKKFIHDLECANMTYNKAITNGVIELANKIDKEILG